MTNNKNYPILQFDFKADQEQTKPIIFSNPTKIIIAHHLNEVHDCLEQVQTAVTAGNYVAGYMSYEATEAFFSDIPTRVDRKMPLLWFGVFKEPTEIMPWPEDNSYQLGEWKMNHTKATYEDNFTKIINAITAKKFKQINYTVKFTSLFSGNPYAYYKALRKAQQSDFSAYLQLENFSILSASPELFFRLKNNQITTRPMKGTIHRGKTYEEDMENEAWLRTSDKNKYENRLTSELMKEELRDLVDQDTLAISKEFAVEKYPTVYQMTSTISGEVLPDITIVDIFKRLFPCGSISGTPKKESMVFIAELEEEAREVYCGAIGYITPNQHAVFNVPIRTVLIDHTTNTADYGAGGAITKHSNATEEYNEVITKTKILHTKRTDFELIETFGLYDGEFIVHDRHIQRLRDSASYFNFSLDIAPIEVALKKFAVKYPVGKWIVRLVVSDTGNFKTEINPIEAFRTNNIVLAAKPIDKEDIFLYHKTTNRGLYTTHREQNETAFDVLLWNEDREITEFTIGNIVVELNGELLTPPISSGLLPGTFRKDLLDKGKIREQIIKIDEVKNCTRIWLINSVRMWVEVELS